MQRAFIAAFFRERSFPASANCPANPVLKNCVAHEQHGGWVNDSKSEAEFQQTVNKSKARLKAVALAETLAKK